MQKSELLNTFNSWTDSLSGDTAPLTRAIVAEETPREAKRLLIGGLSFFIRKFDIVPDHMEGIGLVDDAFVLRVASALAEQSGLGDLDIEVAASIQALGESTPPLEEFLGDLYPGLVELVRALPDQTVRGRTADTVLDDATALENFLREVRVELRQLDVKPLPDSDQVLPEIKSFIKAAVNRVKGQG